MNSPMHGHAWSMHGYAWDVTFYMDHAWDRMGLHGTSVRVFLTPDVEAWYK